MKKVAIIVACVVVALIVLLAAALFYLGPIVRSGVERVGPMVAKVPVKLDGANISFFNGSGQLKGFVLGNPEGFKTTEAMKVGTIEVKVVPKSVLSDKVVVRSVRIESPEITYEAGFGGSNIGKILENIQSVASQEKSQGASSAGKGLQVDDFVISGGKINVSASVLAGKSMTLPLPEIHLSNLGQSAQGITPAELSAKVFGAVVEAAAKVVASSAANLGKPMLDAAQGAGSEAKSRIKNIGSGVSDLLKAKKP